MKNDFSAVVIIDLVEYFNKKKMFFNFRVRRNKPWMLEHVQFLREKNNRTGTQCQMKNVKNVNFPVRLFNIQCTANLLDCFMSVEHTVRDIMQNKLKFLRVYCMGFARARHHRLVVNSQIYPVAGP